MTDTNHNLDNLATKIAVAICSPHTRTSTAKRQIRKPCRCNAHNFDWEGFCRYCGCGHA
jgi:hypothetical protein